MVILGGTGNLWGSILGAVVLVFLPEALKFVDMPPDVADKMRQVIYGLILIGILLVRPQGILGEHRTAPRLARRERTDAHAAEQLGSVSEAAPGDVTIRARGLAKNFGGILAVRHFTLDITRGATPGLSGPTDPGKPTPSNL